MLCTVHPAAGASHVTEAALGAPIASLLPGLSGPGGSEVPQAVLVGGYYGAWMAPGQAARLALSAASPRTGGAAPGAGVLAELPASRCGLAETARVARYLALESAGQCGPCFSGLPRIATALAELAAPRPAPGAAADLRRWAGLVQGRGACRQPDGFVRFVTSALATFGAEAAWHERGRCTATDRTPFLAVPPPPADEADWN